MRNDPLSIPLFSSCFIHLVVFLSASIIIRNSHLLRPDFVPINLVDVPRTEKEPPAQRAEVKPESKKPPPPPAKFEKPKEMKREIIQPERAPLPVPTPVKEEPEKATPSASARVETGGSEAGAGNLFGKGDVAVVPGSGTTGGGGGTADSGLGRGSGAPGLPTPTPVLRTNQEAKPLQTVRAVYPPLALRMGLEGDVALKIEVDTEGKVTKVEITKSGGPGFDEEALKAVKQSRFEPAQKNGKNVLAEFTYIYRFRLRR
jgi:protein TonB